MRGAACAAPAVTLTEFARNRPGTAIVQGKKGQYVWTDGSDEEALSRGVFDTYVKRNLRYSQARRPRLAHPRRCGGVADRRGAQVAPISMYEEKNTGSNLPAQVELYAAKASALRRAACCARAHTASACAGQRVPLPFHGQGWRLRQQNLPIPADQGATVLLAGLRSCADASSSPRRRRC